MVPKKGLSGDPGGYKGILIHRLLCKRTGKTVSMHPRFSHTAKRYTLAFVMECLQYIIELGSSIRATAGHFGIYRSTVRRWMRGFSRHDINAKWACFFHGDLPRKTTAGFAPALLRHFRAMGKGNLEDGTSLAMLRLHDGFSCRLY
ncbi:MAG: helix-turn-helix domain-containing protein [Chitinispirillaceae bacterium]|nr:helix-turn-helix domain-containing protein [Chitinispirillaceae bacterium]